MTVVPFASGAAPAGLPRAAAVRPFVEADIPQVAAVHRAAFRRPDDPGLPVYRDYFLRTFLDNPAGDGPISSLVYQEGDGRIVGFVGLVPRRIVFNRRQYQAVISSQFIVDPASHGGLVALRLAKAYLDGPQDLSIADEANDLSRRIWEGLGGTTALLLSMYWTRPLRPARLAVSYLRARRALAPFAVAAAPLAAAADGVAVRLPGSQFMQRPPSTTAEPLDGRTAVAQAPAFCGDHAAAVEYDDRAFQWLIDRARANAGGGVLNAVVKNGSTTLGWYIARLEADGACELANLAATPSTIHEVLDLLFYHAWRQGAVSVTGRLDPRFMQALSDKYCVFHRRGPWLLIKTHNPELRHAFESGASCFSRLDGEWSLRLRS
jgi:hypothetical protein